MCEFLIVAKNRDSREKSWRKGDPIMCEDNGFGWGKKETLPLFFVLKIPGMSTSKGQSFLSSEYGPEEMIGYDDLDQVGIYRTPVRKRRLWGLLIDNVPQTIRTEIASTGGYTTSVAVIKQFFRNKISDAEMSA